MGSLFGIFAKPGAVISTICGANKIPAIVSAANIIVKNVNALPANLFALSLEPRVNSSVNTGIKETVNAPSPTSLLKKFGIL